MNSPIITYHNDGVRFIKLNRPEKYNPLSPEVFFETVKILNEDALNDNIVITIFTGVGDYYTSGIDLTAGSKDGEDFVAVHKKSVDSFMHFVNALINYPKLLVAVVNGPAVGGGVTTLPLFDIVYASETATFQTPFVPLGVCPEGCSSYTLTLIMGKSKSGQLLYLNQKMTAEEAYQFGLVSNIVKHEKLDELFETLKKFGKELSPNSIKIVKRLIMNEELRNTLLEVNKNEIKQVYHCTSSEEFFEAIVKFLNRKNKL